MKPQDETHENSALGVEVKILRERIDAMTAERHRERGQIVDQIYCRKQEPQG